MVDMTLSDLYAKVIGHLFWYQSIPRIRLPIAVNCNLL